MTSGREIGDTVTNEDNQGDRAIHGCAIAVLGDGLTLVVAEVALVAPDRLPV